jgi:hypothetical protein
MSCHVPRPVHSATDVHFIVSWVGCLLIWSALERISDKEKSFTRLPKDVRTIFLLEYQRHQ